MSSCSHLMSGDKGFGVLQSINLALVNRDGASASLVGNMYQSASVAGPQGTSCLLGNASAHVAQRKCTYAVAVCQELRGASLDQLVL